VNTLPVQQSWFSSAVQINEGVRLKERNAKGLASRFYSNSKARNSGRDMNEKPN
jgi:hypothetical protein